MTKNDEILGNLIQLLIGISMLLVLFVSWNNLTVMIKIILGFIGTPLLAYSVINLMFNIRERRKLI
jgi:hypothetical protein